MKSGIGCKALVIACVLASTAFAQSSTSTTTAVSAVQTALDASATGTGPATAVKQILRSEITQLVIAEVHALFQQIRPVLGFADTAADPTTDPLALLESMVVSAISASTSTSSSN